MAEDEEAAKAGARGPETGVLRQLREKSREELLALIEQLLQRQPERESLVEVLIELPLLGSGQTGKLPGRGTGRTLDPSRIRNQVASAFYGAGEGWGAAGRVAAELEKLYEIGNTFVEAGQWANAQIIYGTVAEEAIASYERLDDQGEISWVIKELTEKLLQLHREDEALKVATETLLDPMDVT